MNTLAHIVFAIGGMVALATITIEVRRAFHPNSAVRQLLAMWRAE